MNGKPGPFVQPNLYNLSGDGLYVVYSTTGIDGKPHFSYHDAHQTLTFVGDQIETLQSEFGALVTVVIVRTVDFGSTIFTVLIPRVNLHAGESVPIRTDGITTLHKFSIVPAFLHGQLDLYTVRRLHGTAAQVMF